MSKLYNNFQNREKYKFFKIEPEETNHIFRPNLFYSLYDTFLNEDWGKRAIEALEEKQIYINKLKSSRILYHWGKKGLLNYYRKNEKGWRKFSLLDRFWLLIICELRNFGLPLKNIYNIGKDLGILEENKNHYRQYLFHYYVPIINTFKDDIYNLIIFSNDEADILSYSEYRDRISLFGMDHHLTINLNGIFNLSTDPIGKNSNEYIPKDLTDAEFELIDIIRKHGYKSIQIKTKEGKIKNIEAKRNVDVNTRIGSLLKHSKFGEIIIKKDSDKIVQIEETLKRKFDY
ncbi:hypothetical protein JW835_14400 [bacterium]|nr:hypothetical protein [bacterium]